MVGTLLSVDRCSKAPLPIKEKTIGEMAPWGLCFQFSLSIRQSRSQPSLGRPQCCQGVELCVLSLSFMARCVGGRKESRSHLMGSRKVSPLCLGLRRGGGEEPEAGP